jgi:osmoprotectant transport system permease protein
VTEAFARVPELLASHVLLSGAALLLGLVLALPLTVLASRSPGIARVALGFASLVQTIPALALLALFFPILLFAGLPALGFLPSLLALSLYALLPILRNGVTGIAGLDPAVIEAADGVGMTSAQRLWLVEAPLAAPMLMAGVRTAAVWTIGAATLSTTVGQPSLGDLIFAGLQTQNWAIVLAGCLAAAALALAVDALLGLAERGIATRRRWMWLAPLCALLTGAAVAVAPRLLAQPETVVIGAKSFSEQFILARVIGHQLEQAGYRVEIREGLGSAVAFGALATGAVDVAVDYSGTIWTNQMRRTTSPPREAMLAAIGRWTRAQHGVRLLGPLGFENAYAFAMRGQDARARGITTLEDLAVAAPGLRLGADIEFLERPEWRAIRSAYGLRFARAQAYQPTFMYRALASGEADVISAFSSDGRVATDGLAVLGDPRRAIPGYDAILMVAPKRARDSRFTAALQPLINRIAVEAMREANAMVDRDERKASPEAAARWLAKRAGL